MALFAIAAATLLMPAPIITPRRAPPPASVGDMFIDVMTQRADRSWIIDTRMVYIITTYPK